MNWFYINKTHKKSVGSVKSVKSETDYIHQIVNLKYKSVELLKAESTNFTNTFFESIKQTDITQYKLPSDYFDCIILGGGMKGYYVYGGIILLKKMMDMGKIKIRKFVGVSVGALLCIFVFSGIDIKIMKNFSEFALENNKLHPIDNILIKACWELLPDDIHLKVNGKISILLSKSTLPRTSLFDSREHFIEHFDSKLHLIMVLHATCCIPFITTNKIGGININGTRYYDGVFTYKNPINPNNDIPQLVFQTGKVKYSLEKSLSFNDEFPELLVMKGLLEFEKFITNLNNNIPNKIPIKWIHHIPNKINKNKINYNSKTKKYIYNIIIFLFLAITEIIYLLGRKIN